MNNTVIDPIELSAMMRQEFAPTAEQAAVIGAPMQPLLVVAGAGAGKTETMAARVVWLVANGFVRPEEVLGLTFTRKAASELGQRIRARLATLAASEQFRRVADAEVLESLEVIVPTVKTYNAYALMLVKEYGLLLPTEPSAQVLNNAEKWQKTWTIAQNAKGLNTKLSTTKLVEKLMRLSDEIDGNLVDEAEVREQTQAFVNVIEQLPKSPKQSKDLHTDLVKVDEAQRDRLQLLPLVEQLRQSYAEDNAATFDMQMSQAARLASSVAEVGKSQRDRFKVIMLDEYQDTSHAQRILLRSLFAGSAVTAVGDPMQAIYGWRGATATNLVRFTHDFPQTNGQPAEKLQLLTSWRNPIAVLEAANHVSDQAFAGQPRTVGRLVPRPGAATGNVELALHLDKDQELAWVAEKFSTAYVQAQESGKTFSGAVLVRKNVHAAPVLQALNAVGVPAEIVGVGGLLAIPEVADIVSILRVLNDPADNEAMLRVLTSPIVQLGAADIHAVKKRAVDIAASGRFSAPFSDDASPMEKLYAYLDDLVAEQHSEPVGFGYAVADPALDDDSDHAPAYSDEGKRRLRELSRTLGFIRRWSLRKPLPELIADVEEAFGIRIEATVAAATDNQAVNSGTVHLDKFIEIAADYSRQEGGDIASFLGYLAIADEEERGLEPGKVKQHGDAVQIMTIHKSKGLEWDIVSVPHLCANEYDEVRLSCWTNNADRLMPELIGADDADAAASSAHAAAKTAVRIDGAPILDSASAEHQGELAKAIKAHRDELREAVVDESQRLFYVAVTRAAQTLLVSGCHWNSMGKRPSKPSEKLEALAKKLPDYVDIWADSTTENPLDIEGLDSAEWPVDPLGQRRGEVEHAAQLVAVELAALPATDTAQAEHAAQVEHTEQVEAPQQTQTCAVPAPPVGDISAVWAREVELLLEERRHARESTVEVEHPVQLSASEYIALRRDPDAFARRKARPVPFKPNRFARRGTAFHAWLEGFFGTNTLMDEEDLFTIHDTFGEGFGEDIAVENLKRIFQESEWADRTPEDVEVPFDISLGGQRVVGRIDAVFRIGDQWVVVDWKTGRPATGQDLTFKALQLAIYRIAWADILRSRGEKVEAEDIKAAFFYLNPAGRSETVWPDKKDLPNRLELVEAIKLHSPDELHSQDELHNQNDNGGRRDPSA